MTLAERMRDQAAACGLMGSPMYAELLSRAADDLVAGGPIVELLAGHEGDPAGSVVPLRLTAALHRLVLQRQAPRLALHYPSVGGTAPPGDAWPAVREASETQRSLLAGHLRRPVQTNEVGRSAAIYGGLLAVAHRTALPIRLLEIGASAGLNLRCDVFGYAVAGSVLGDAASPVLMADPWIGLPAPLDTRLRIAGRAGCDPAPLDPGSTADRLTLTSCVWADQVARVERLRAALDVATRHPVRVQQASAADWLADELAEPVPDTATVVMHSIVWQYVAAAEQLRILAVVDAAGARATDRAPLAHLACEPDFRGVSASGFDVTLRLWPGGSETVLGRASAHGPPVTWST